MARAVNIHNIAVVMGNAGLYCAPPEQWEYRWSFPEHAGQDFHLVPFLSGRGKLTLARLSPVQIGLDVPFFQRQSGRAAVHHHADSLSMDSPQVVTLNIVPNAEPAIYCLLSSCIYNPLSR